MKRERHGGCHDEQPRERDRHTVMAHSPVNPQCEGSHSRLRSAWFLGLA
jgi:hypothetical protein